MQLSQIFKLNTDFCCEILNRNFLYDLMLFIFKKLEFCNSIIFQSLNSPELHRTILLGTSYQH